MGTASATAKAPSNSAILQKAAQGRALMQPARLLPSNRALLRLQRQCSCGRTCDECKQSAQNIQRLSISPAADPLEREADHIGDKVMRQSAAPVSVSAAPSGVSSAPNLTPHAETQVNIVLAAPGRRLDTGFRTDMEGRFGADFSAVRTHVGQSAEAATEAVNAKAFTVGAHIVFGRDTYSPGTSTGRRLFAHELAHVVQQSKGSGVVYPVLQRLPGDGMKPPGDCTKQEHFVLSAAVKAAEVATRGAGCNEADTCVTLAPKIVAFATEITARVAVAAKCFKGGDTGHQTQIRNKMKALNNCVELFESQKCKDKLDAAAEAAVKTAAATATAASAAVLAAEAIEAAGGVAAGLEWLWLLFAL